jgi:hypothetical protein
MRAAEAMAAKNLQKKVVSRGLARASKTGSVDRWLSGESGRKEEFHADVAVQQDFEARRLT